MIKKLYSRIVTWKKERLKNKIRYLRYQVFMAERSVSLGFAMGGDRENLNEMKIQLKKLEVKLDNNE